METAREREGKIEVRFRGDALDLGREGRGNIFRIGFCLLLDMYFRWVTLVLCIAGVKVDRVWAKLQTGERSFPRLYVIPMSYPLIVPSQPPAVLTMLSLRKGGHVWVMRNNV